MFGPLGGFTDPFVLPPVPLSNGQINFTTNGLALRTQSVNTSVKNLIIIAAGQSNITNVAPTAYTPTNAASIDCMNVNDGCIYAAADPLLGCSINPTLGPGNPMLRLADNLISSSIFARIII